MVQEIHILVRNKGNIVDTRVSEESQADSFILYCYSD